MPREYKSINGARKYGNSEDRVQAALQEIAKGMSQREASRTFKIPRGTIQNRIAGRHVGKPGHPTVLSDVEETSLVDHVKLLGDWGFPLDKFDLKMLVKSHLDKAGKTVSIFKNNYPGDEWFQSFMSTTCCISEGRKEQSTSSHFQKLLMTIQYQMNRYAPSSRHPRLCGEESISFKGFLSMG